MSFGATSAILGQRSAIHQLHLKLLAETLTDKVPDVSHILRFCAKCTNHTTHAAKKSAKKRA
ncbi:Hypothetical protein PHPALM_16971 [Phytophthora palmivora]|uniref:Uncharacterized protein n=1 Tax=Phytophthora palmivora TaxID=4796 RepID=A0A2P4XNE0_9STRA|nr:Hypothetical protein PHPALM_16971 [Phytophthora palmivora]